MLGCYAATAQVDAVARAQRMASQLAHLHLADGTVGSLPRDEHLVPGQGNQPCAEVRPWTAGSAASVVFDGSTTLSAADASLSCHRPCPAQQSDVPHPDRKDHQHDHGRQDQDPATATRRRS